MGKGSGAGGARGGGGGKSSAQQQWEAIHQFQQVSWEGITPSDRSALRDFINSNPDVTDQVTRGMVVSEDTINRWIEGGEVSHQGMNSWTTGGSASDFSRVDRYVDADEGKRSVILVSPKGLPNSAQLPRTNSYKENEVLTTTTKFKILSYKKQRPYSAVDNKSPYEMIITVEPVRKSAYKGKGKR